MSGSDARLFHELVARVNDLVTRIEALETLVEGLSDRMPDRMSDRKRGEPFPPRDGKAGVA